MLRRKSFFAGIFIGLAASIFLAVGELCGAALFAFGLICIVYLELNLFTGMSGELCIDLYIIYGIKKLGRVLLWNIVGTAVMALILKKTRPDLISSVMDILQTRLDCSYLSGFFKAVGCGFIMDTIVYLYKSKTKILPILFGIPVFILLEFYHCIADSFYIFAGIFGGFSFDLKILFMYLITILGNFLGCNLRKIYG